jgi:hypothetical protein
MKYCVPLTEAGVLVGITSLGVALGLKVLATFGVILGKGGKAVHVAVGVSLGAIGEGVNVRVAVGEDVAVAVAAKRGVDVAGGLTGVSVATSNVAVALGMSVGVALGKTCAGMSVGVTNNAGIGVGLLGATVRTSASMRRNWHHQQAVIAP